jgi:hypothetical protein
VNKFCNCCKIQKSFFEYHKKTKSKDGLNDICKSCANEKARMWYDKNKERNHETMRKWRFKNRDKYLADSSAWQYNNKDRVKDKNRRWRDKNRGLCNSFKAKRRSFKRNATPKWLTDKQKSAIRCLYIIANFLSNKTGIKYHVDHIHPLAGDNFAGLHVPWNLRIIPAQDNMVKSNKMPSKDEHLKWSY